MLEFFPSGTATTNKRLLLQPCMSKTKNKRVEGINSSRAGIVNPTMPLVRSTSLTIIYSICTTYETFDECFVEKKEPPQEMARILSR